MEEATGREHHLSGQVRLSVAEGFGTWVLSPGLADFSRRHPGIRLDLITASGFLNPSKREADMAVMLEIRRASCRERECQYVAISVVAVSSKNKWGRGNGH